MAKKWELYEESFLRKHLFEDPKEVHLLFSEQYGLTRSLESVRKKMIRLREEEIESQETAEELEEVYSPLHLLDPAIVKQQAALWLREVSKIKPSTFDNTNHVRSNNKSLVIVISDVHWGKKTNTFNMDIASNRILSIPHYLYHSDIPNFDEIVVILLGDLVEGEDIFAHQQSVIEAPVISAWKQGTEAIWQLLLDLQERFNVPIRVECVPGNHGRMSKTANPVSNWDSAIALSLQMINKAAQQENIDIDVSLHPFKVINVKGARLLLYHETPKQIGTAAPALKVAGWVISKDVDILVGGHYHYRSFESYMGRSKISNGCVPGGDDLGERMGREDPASQCYFFIDPTKEGWISSYHFLQW